MEELPHSEEALSTFLRKLPTNPGIYKFIRKDNNPIYIGKAKNLRKRVTSYFRASKDKTQKIKNLVKEALFIDITITNTELEALLLEQHQIKEFRPKFNVQFKDDKGYPWIKIESEKLFPSAKSFLGKKDKKGKYYGPYPSSYAVRETLSLIQKAFRLRNCNDSFFRNRARPCMQYEIGRCSAPCVKLISKKDYLKDVKASEMILEGRSEDLMQDFYSSMDDLSKNHLYEKAAIYRDKISALRDIQRSQSIAGFSKERDAVVLCSMGGVTKIGITRVNKGWITSHENFIPKNIDIDVSLLESFLKVHYLADAFCPQTIVLEGSISDKKIIEEALTKHHKKIIKIITKPSKKDKGLLEITKSNTSLALKRSTKDINDISRVLTSLKNYLGIKNKIRLIESYDISHHSTIGAVAGCVVYSNKGKLKNRYRSFKITKENAGNDIASMKEVILRRFNNQELLEELPDLIIIDGGKVHLEAVRTILNRLNIKDIELLSISKGARRKAEMDSIHRMDGSVIRVTKGSSSHLLLQEIRDETHRFAIFNQRKKQLKISMKSSLDQINGIGENKKKILLRYFGSVEQIKRASAQDLNKVLGIGVKMADLIYNHFH